MKNKTEVIIFEDDSCEQDLPENPKDFLKWWQDKFDLIPDEFMSIAKVKCETYETDGFSNLDVTIIYYRDETDLEIAMRKNEIERKKQNQHQSDWNEFERLKKKLNA